MPWALLTALSLAGCHDKAGDGQVASGGEVLPGSASDAMIAYDTLRSQPPLAPSPTFPRGRAGLDEGAVAADGASGAPSDSASIAATVPAAHGEQPAPQPSGP